MTVGLDPRADLVRFLADHDEDDMGAEAWKREIARIATGAKIHPSVQMFDPVVMTRPDHIVIGQYSRIDSFTKLEGGIRLDIGEYVHIASFAHLGIGGGITIIEDYAAVASGGKVISGSNQTSADSMSAAAPADRQKVTTSTTVLEPYSCVLTNAVVLPGVTLGEGAVLAAGAVATRDVPPWEIWAGVPAKFLAKRVVKSK